MLPRHKTGPGQLTRCCDSALGVVNRTCPHATFFPARCRDSQAVEATRLLEGIVRFHVQPRRKLGFSSTTSTVVPPNGPGHLRPRRGRSEAVRCDIHRSVAAAGPTGGSVTATHASIVLRHTPGRQSCPKQVSWRIGIDQQIPLWIVLADCRWPRFPGAGQRLPPTWSSGQPRIRRSSTATRYSGRPIRTVAVHFSTSHGRPSLPIRSKRPRRWCLRYPSLPAGVAGSPGAWRIDAVPRPRKRDSSAASAAWLRPPRSLPSPRRPGKRVGSTG